MDEPPPRPDASEPAEARAVESPWAAPPTLKERSGVERAVQRLLDLLAPERPVTRAARLPLPVERHRTPRGCILQGPAAAVSVSWFPDAATDAAIGELQVIAWRGVVSRPGSAHRAPDGATIARQVLLRPEDSQSRAENGAAEWVWRADDGTLYDTDALAAYCLALLEQQVAGGGAATTAESSR